MSVIAKYVSGSGDDTAEYEIDVEKNGDGVTITETRTNKKTGKPWGGPIKPKELKKAIFHSEDWTYDIPGSKKKGKGHRHILDSSEGGSLEICCPADEDEKEVPPSSGS